MRNSALVVVDMLYDFIDGSLACANAENAVKPLWASSIHRQRDRKEKITRSLTPFLSFSSATTILQIILRSRSREGYGLHTALPAPKVVKSTKTLLRMPARSSPSTRDATKRQSNIPDSTESIMQASHSERCWSFSTPLTSMSAA